MKPGNIFDYLRHWIRRVKMDRNNKDPFKTYEMEKLRARLLVYMRTKKPYLKRGYKIKDMAADLGVPAYRLSALINKVMGTHFADLVNRSRVEYCKRVLRSNRGGTQSMRDLASQCGFNNRNTFTTAFKKYTGINPSQYLQSP